MNKRIFSPRALLLGLFFLSANALSASCGEYIYMYWTDLSNIGTGVNYARKVCPINCGPEVEVTGHPAVNIKCSELPPVTGIIIPDYKIMSIIYAPPGTKGGSPSSVTYSDQSSLGTSTSASNSVNQSYSFSAKSTISGVTVSNDFSFLKNQSNKSVLDIKKKETSTYTYPGSNQVDGVNHDHDRIVLWLRPRIIVESSTSSGSWEFEPDQDMHLISVFVGHLKNPSEMPLSIYQALQEAGITEDVYSDILAAHPLLGNGGDLDYDRFKYVSTYTYAPPYYPGDLTSTFTRKAEYWEDSIDSSIIESQHSVGLTIEADANFLDVFSANLKTSTKWTWTEVDTQIGSAGKYETMTYTIHGPSYDYDGSTSIAVYYDVIYKTFAFIPY